jgi:hypothetical protein
MPMQFSFLKHKNKKGTWKLSVSLFLFGSFALESFLICHDWSKMITRELQGKRQLT